MTFLKNKILCNKKKIISNLLLLCIRISLFDKTLVYDSKSCGMQYITFFWSSFPWLNTQCSKLAVRNRAQGKGRGSVVQRIPLLVVHRSIFSALAVAEVCFACTRAPGEDWSSILHPLSSNITL